MSELATLARPYAEAIAALAKQDDSFDKWSEDLANLVAIISDSDMKAIIYNPRIAKDTLKKLMLDVCETVSDATKNLIKVLVDNQRLEVIPQIVEQYETLKSEYKGYAKVEIISAYEVSPEQQQAVINSMSSRLGKAVTITVSHDASLMGGWLLRVGDEVTDLSVRGRLQKLSAELRH